jgi:putative transposase
MSEFTRYGYRLYPTSQQSRALERWAGCARAVWNAALEQRRTAWRMSRTGLRYESQGGAELSEAKRAHPWLCEPHSDVLQQTLRDLDRAHRDWLAGRAGWPRFKRKGRESFRVQSRRRRSDIAVRRVSRRWGEVRIPKLGWVRFRWSRKPDGEIKHATVLRNALGWHVSLCCERVRSIPAVPLGPPIAIDRGVAATVATSTGELHRCPGLPPKQAERLRRLERKAGRQETARRHRPPYRRHRSRRHQRTLDRITRLRARQARIRRDFLHKLSTDLAKSHGVVVIERLDVRAMTRSARGTIIEPGRGVRAKAGLNRAVLAQGWGELRRQLAYKCERTGGRLVEVPAPYTSQRCSRCHAVHHRSRRGRRFACLTCGNVDDADVNAAKNILAAGRAVTARGALAARRGQEPRTTRRAQADAA